jgi:hypothetical protein
MAPPTRDSAVDVILASRAFAAVESLRTAVAHAADDSRLLRSARAWRSDFLALSPASQTLVALLVVVTTVVTHAVLRRYAPAGSTPAIPQLFLRLLQ